MAIVLQLMAFDMDLVSVGSISGINVFRLGESDVGGLFLIDMSSVLEATCCCSSVVKIAAVMVNKSPYVADLLV
jgi:molybdate-binding protein